MGAASPTRHVERGDTTMRLTHQQWLQEDFVIKVCPDFRDQAADEPQHWYILLGECVGVDLRGSPASARLVIRTSIDGVKVEVPSSEVLRYPLPRSDGQRDPDWQNRLLYESPMGALEVGLRVVVFHIPLGWSMIGQLVDDRTAGR